MVVDNTNAEESPSTMRGYSRSQWSALSIQDRIRAMNETLDTVEKTTTTSSSEAPTPPVTEEKTPPPTNPTPPPPAESEKRSSVVDIWRKREGSKSTGAVKVAPGGGDEDQEQRQPHRNGLKKVKTELTSRLGGNPSLETDSLNDVKTRLANQFQGIKDEEEKKSDAGSEGPEPAASATPNSTTTTPPTTVRKWGRGVASASPTPPPLPGSGHKGNTAATPTTSPLLKTNSDEPMDLTILPAASSNLSTGENNSASKFKRGGSNKVASIWEKMSSQQASFNEDEQVPQKEVKAARTPSQPTKPKSSSVPTDLTILPAASSNLSTGENNDAPKFKRRGSKVASIWEKMNSQQSSLIEEEQGSVPREEVKAQPTPPQPTPPQPTQRKSVVDIWKNRASPGGAEAAETGTDKSQVDATPQPIRAAETPSPVILRKTGLADRWKPQRSDSNKKPARKLPNTNKQVASEEDPPALSSVPPLPPNGVETSRSANPVNIETSNSFVRDRLGRSNSTTSIAGKVEPSFSMRSNVEKVEQSPSTISNASEKEETPNPETSDTARVVASPSSKVRGSVADRWKSAIKSKSSADMSQERSPSPVPAKQPTSATDLSQDKSPSPKQPKSDGAIGRAKVGKRWNLGQVQPPPFVDTHDDSGSAAAAAAVKIPSLPHDTKAQKVIQTANGQPSTSEETTDLDASTDSKSPKKASPVRPRAVPLPPGPSYPILTKDVSALVQQHASRTPTGKVRSKGFGRGSIDSHDSAKLFFNEASTIPSLDEIHATSSSMPGQYASTSISTIPSREDGHDFVNSISIEPVNSSPVNEQASGNMALHRWKVNSTPPAFGEDVAIDGKQTDSKKGISLPSPRTRGSIANRWLRRDKEEITEEVGIANSVVADIVKDHAHQTPFGTKRGQQSPPSKEQQVDLQGETDHGAADSGDANQTSEEQTPEEQRAHDSDKTDAKNNQDSERQGMPAVRNGNSHHTSQSHGRRSTEERWKRRIPLAQRIESSLKTSVIGSKSPSISSPSPSGEERTPTVSRSEAPGLSFAARNRRFMGKAASETKPKADSDFLPYLDGASDLLAVASFGTDITENSENFKSPASDTMLDRSNSEKCGRASPLKIIKAWSEHKSASRGSVRHASTGTDAPHHKATDGRQANTNMTSPFEIISAWSQQATPRGHGQSVPYELPRLPQPVYQKEGKETVSADTSETRGKNIKSEKRTRKNLTNLGQRYVGYGSTHSSSEGDHLPGADSAQEHSADIEHHHSDNTLPPAGRTKKKNFKELGRRHVVARSQPKLPETGTDHDYIHEGEPKKSGDEGEPKMLGVEVLPMKLGDEEGAPKTLGDDTGNSERFHEDSDTAPTADAATITNIDHSFHSQHSESGVNKHSPQKKNFKDLGRKHIDKRFHKGSNGFEHEAPRDAATSHEPETEITIGHKTSPKEICRESVVRHARAPVVAAGEPFVERESSRDSSGMPLDSPVKEETPISRLTMLGKRHVLPAKPSTRSPDVSIDAAPGVVDDSSDQTDSREISDSQREESIPYQYIDSGTSRKSSVNDSSTSYRSGSESLLSGPMDAPGVMPFGHANLSREGMRQISGLPRKHQRVDRNPELLTNEVKDLTLDIDAIINNAPCEDSGIISQIVMESKMKHEVAHPPEFQHLLGESLEGQSQSLTSNIDSLQSFITTAESDKSPFDAVCQTATSHESFASKGGLQECLHNGDESFKHAIGQMQIKERAAAPANIGEKKERLLPEGVKEGLSTRYNRSSRFMDSDGVAAVPAEEAESITESSCAASGSVSRSTADDLASEAQSAPSRTRQQHNGNRDDAVSVKTDKSAKSTHTAWDAASDLVGLDFNKLASTLDGQVAAIRDLVNPKPDSNSSHRDATKEEKPSLQVPKRTDSDVEDVAIEVEYVEESFEEGCNTTPLRKACANATGCADDSSSPMSMAFSPCANLGEHELNFGSQSGAPERGCV